MHRTDPAPMIASRPAVALDSPETSPVIARLVLPGWSVFAEASEDGPRPVAAVWAQSAEGWPGGESELDAAGVDEVLAQLPQFAARLRALRASLIVGTEVAAR